MNNVDTRLGEMKHISAQQPHTNIVQTCSYPPTPFRNPTVISRT